MLSYRHAFHAGNHADILKHAILSRIVIHFTQKEKPFSYIDTHAGAGLYGLDADWAKKTGEAERGILSIFDREDIPDELDAYLQLCRKTYALGHRYPGSPEIVRGLSREGDQLTLMELHPAEIENLRANLSGDPRIHIHHRDGFAGAIALCPPEPRRGFALIDPSYETADDYEKAAETIITLNRRWPAGTIVLWYPIVERRAENLVSIKDKIRAAGISEILLAELVVTSHDESGDGFGLDGSGMLIVRPPWKLKDEIDAFLPWLVSALGESSAARGETKWLSGTDATISP